MWQTPFLEPAFYFLEEKLSRSNDYIPDETLREVNPALEFFRIGLHDFFTKWRRRHLRVGRWATSENIEKQFLESIFAAAYMREDLAVKHTQEYLNLDSMQEKAKKLNETMNIFEGLSKNINSADPEDGYNRCLVAMWSSFILTIHYDSNKDETNGDLIYEQLEKNTRKLLNHPLRGPPEYKF